MFCRNYLFKFYVSMQLKNTLYIIIINQNFKKYSIKSDENLYDRYLNLDVVKHRNVKR